MELSSPKIKKFQEGTFQALKIKKTYSGKNSYVLGKWNFLAPSLKDFLYFLRKKLSLYSGN